MVDSESSTGSYAARRRVLIVSSHPLFGQGLKSLLQQRPQSDVEVIGIVTSVEGAIEALGVSQPDLVILDYDDELVNRNEFLTRYVGGAGSLRLVLLSLNEGSGEAVIYDRHSMPASQIDEWLKEWNNPKKTDQRWSLFE